MAERRRNWGMVAEFDNPARLLEAAQKTRDAGYRKFETWSPFPVHGMDGAMGLGGSRVPWITLCGAICGLSLGAWLQWWTGTTAYPLVIGGKPLFTWEFGVPVMFELTILLSAFGTVFGMFFLNRLPRPYHPLDKHAPFRGVTDDKFFLSIEVADPKFDLARTEAFLTEMGGRNVAVVEE